MHLKSQENGNIRKAKMSIELGHFSLCLSLGIGIFVGITGIIGSWRQDSRLISLSYGSTFILFFLIVLAFMSLMNAYIVSDFSVTNVILNSHSEKPLLYRISGVWGNHEGSLLLWVLILTFYSFCILVFGNKLPSVLLSRVLAIQGGIASGFIGFILFTSNPFLRTFPPAINGNGLNPVLQDPGLAFHPPLLYMGYVGMSVPFSFAIAALLSSNGINSIFARWIRPWVLCSWCFLTLGISLGSWWAYYELGWGGWWFWDPVENASFMPWLASTALLHSSIVAEKRDSLKSWTILLSIIAFSLSLLGTFLVRSGVLTSVHAFASDPARGIYILAFFVVVTGGSLILFACRAVSLETKVNFSPISRESALLVNNVLFSAATCTVLLGTLWPLIIDAIFDRSISVGPPYFIAVFLPLSIPAIILSSFSPMLSWKRSDLLIALKKMMYSGIVTVIVIASFYWYMEGTHLPGILGIGLGTWLTCGVFTEFAERIKLGKFKVYESFRRAKNLPRRNYGMSVAHLGVAVLVFGITVSSEWKIEIEKMVLPGEEIFLANYNIVFEGVEKVKGPNWNGERGIFNVKYGDENFYLNSEKRVYMASNMPTTEAGINSKILGDLYVVIGENDPINKELRAVRIYHNPLVGWIWLGAFIMALGGFISLSDRFFILGFFSSKSNKNVLAAES